MTQATTSTGKKASFAMLLIFPSLLFIPVAAFSQLTWKCVSGNPPFAARGYHSALSYDNKLWVLHGMNGSEKPADIWHTTTGASWTKATGSVPYPMRCGMGALVFDGYMWIVAGGENC